MRLFNGQCGALPIYRLRLRGFNNRNVVAYTELAGQTGCRLLALAMAMATVGVAFDKIGFAAFVVGNKLRWALWE